MRLLDEVPRLLPVNDYGGVLPCGDGCEGVSSPQVCVFPPLALSVGGAGESFNSFAVYLGTIRFLLSSYRLARGGWSWLLKPFAAHTPPPRPFSYGLDEFCAIYVMLKTGRGFFFFKRQSGWQKLIVNLVYNDHRWNGTVI